MRDGVGRLGRTELTVLLAMATALTALGIDLMLPSFTAIRADLGLPVGSTQTSGLVTTYFLGLAGGQLVYGPLADRFGRRPMLFAGFAIYGAAAIGAALAPSLGWLLFARVVWGFGAAGPRVVVFAIVRDVYDGDRMARAMSTIMAVFILVPVFAPSLGAVVAEATSWRWLLGSCFVVAAALALWARRLPETLADEFRLPLSPGRVAIAARAVVRTRSTVGYTLGMTAFFGAFTAYLGSAELIFGTTFGLSSWFPVLFGVSAAAMGVTAFTNGRVVERVGAHRVASRALAAYLTVATVLFVVALMTAGRPPAWLFLVLIVPLLCSHALTIPNANTLAMQPMKAIAGTAAALIGATQIAGGALLGALLDRAFDGTILPLASGFLGLGILGAVLIRLGERARLSELAAAADGLDPATTVARTPAPRS